MNLLQDIITYVRRIIKSPSNTVITDNLIIDYINRFWINDVDARIQLFDLKTKYQFQTVPGIDQYNMPLYPIQTEPGNQNISYYPVYQGFEGPAFINGIQVPFQTEKNSFFNIWPNVVQISNLGVGNGTAGPYNFTIPLAPNSTVPVTTPSQYLLRGHVDITGMIYSGLAPAAYPLVSSLNTSIPTTNTFPAIYITTGVGVTICDTGQYLSSDASYGLLARQDPSQTGNIPLPNGYSANTNVVNYFTGQINNLYFAGPIPSGTNIDAQFYLFQTGLPRGILFTNNTLIFRSPPDQSYLVEIDAYLSPAAFLSTGQAIQFGYMSEYIARGAARKILADTGDIEQFQFYEPLFKEQETLVWKRSQRQFTANRTQTIYSQGINQGQSGFNNLGGSSI